MALPRKKSKIFKTINGDPIEVSIFRKRITLECNGISASYSCYDIKLIPELHDKLMSRLMLDTIDLWIKDNCEYLQEDKPSEGEQFSLF